MSVSVETLSGLKRKITVSVPAEVFDEAFDSKIKKISHKVKIDGFRPGKVPLNLVKQRYALSVTQEVAQELIQSSLYDALQSQQLTPVAPPEIEPEQLGLGQPFLYHALFEVFPVFDIAELEGDTVELVSAEVQDSDVDTMIEQLRSKSKRWNEVQRSAQLGDKVTIDFQGFIDDKPFEGGKAEDYSLELGSKAMIPGFEDGILGLSAGESKDIHVTFPDNYNHADLAGKEARFHIVLRTVLEGQLPELDDEFAKQFNVKAGGVDALRSDVKENMARELTRRVSAANREAIFDVLLKKNPIEIPEALVNQEIKHLQHEMYHQIFGNEHSENEKIPDFPRALFEEKAKRRVHLGLLFSDYVKKHNIQVDSARVDAMIEVFASAYERPDDVRAWYRGSKERLAEIEGLVMEELVADQIVLNASVSQKTKTYDDIMNPKQQNDEKESSQ